MIQNIEGQNSDVRTEMSNFNKTESNQASSNTKITITNNFKKFRNNYTCQSTPDGFQIGKWQKDEHILFLRACEKYGNNWAKVKFFIFLTFLILCRFKTRSKPDQQLRSDHMLRSISLNYARNIG
jgi:hypothetical protein